MKRIFNYISIFGKKRFQNIFEIIFKISLKGLNYKSRNFEKNGELYVLKYIQEKFGKEAALTIFDVGGNVGNYSKSLSIFFNDKATIHSFEPSKKTYQIFLETTKNIQNIIPNNFGLSNHVQNQLLYTNCDGSGLASMYQRNLDHIGISMEKSEEIALSTIDNYCEANNLQRIHFLKLDIEGHELKALNGAKKMMGEKKIDFIQFEFGGCNIDSRTYFQDFYLLLKDNYKIYRILRKCLFEISKYKETYEIFTTINYLAIRK
ncbi:FkbM family methyltransferase [Polaribacter sp. M15]